MLPLPPIFFHFNAKNHANLVTFSSNKEIYHKNALQFSSAIGYY